MDRSLNPVKKSCGICLAFYEREQLFGRIIPIDPTAECEHVFHYLCIASHLVRNPVKSVIEGNLATLCGISCCPLCKIKFSNIASMTNIPGVTLDNPCIDVSESECEISPAIKKRESRSQSTQRILASTKKLDSPSKITTNNEDRDISLAESQKVMEPVVVQNKIPRKIILSPKSKRLKTHVKTDFICEICEEPYDNAKAKFRCQERHHGPYACPTPGCDAKPFKRKDYLQKHSKTVHGRTLNVSDCKGINEQQTANNKTDESELQPCFSLKLIER